MEEDVHELLEILAGVGQKVSRERDEARAVAREMFEWLEGEIGPCHAFVVRLREQYPWLKEEG